MSGGGFSRYPVLSARITKWLESSIDDKGVPEGMIMDMIEALRTIQFSYGAKICSGEDFKRPISDLLHAADKQMYIHKRRTRPAKQNIKIVQFSHKSLEDSQERCGQRSVITGL